MGSLVRNVLTQPIFTRKITPALPMVVAILNIILLFYIIERVDSEKRYNETGRSLHSGFSGIEAGT